MFGENQTLHSNLRIIQALKHGGGSIMVWGWFAASGPGWIAIIVGPMNSALYRRMSGYLFMN